MPRRRPLARSSTSRPDPAVPRGRILVPSTTGITNTYTNPVYNMDDKSVSSSLDKNGFLKMLTAQMKNQDPTSGQDPNQYFQTISQMTTVEQLTNLATASTAALSRQKDANATQ